MVVSGAVSELDKYLDTSKLHGIPASEIKNLHLRKEYHPDWALPSHTLLVDQVDYTPPSDDVGEKLIITLNRHLLSTEAVYKHRQLVLLGAPGSGKSTFLRHLAWTLAQQGLEQLPNATALHSWDDQRWLLPIVVPLRTLAGHIATQGAYDMTVYAALRDAMQSYYVQQVDDLLNESLHRSTVLLLFDGLDEVPLVAVPGISADRITTLAVVRSFIKLHEQVRAVVTCRTRAFDEHLRATLGWHTETIIPFRLGQVRHFVPAFYSGLVASGQLDKAQGGRLEEHMIATIVTSRKLRAMAEIPLLLTMMALVLYHDGILPRDRPLFYERILELLLGRWDKVREGHSLAEAIGKPDWDSDRIRPLLDELSYRAHADATSEDGRGRLRRGHVRDALIVFFETARLGQPWEAARRCLDYFEQRSGLLVPDETDTYTFAHLTLQEYCAGRYMLRAPDAADLVMRHRTEDRWREPIFLGLGSVQKDNPSLVTDILARLIHRREGKEQKQVERWYRDLILAAEIGQDRDWNYLRTQRVDVDRLQDDLKAGLVGLLGDKTQPLPVAERIRAGFLLGDLGDPRFPMTIEEWRRELARAQAGDTSGYFCRVEAGTYMIGSSDDDADAGEEERPQYTVTFDAPFLIARYPITNAQWGAWVEKAGGQPPYFAGDADINQPNQPVFGVNWHTCQAFCAWLNQQLGVAVRMPTEQEWEAAARGGDARRYPWGDEWQDDRAATAEDQDIRGARYSVPVGCYPVGVAPCGACDMAGNVWEWTASVWESYPGVQKPFTDDTLRVLHGGDWRNNRERVRCGARGARHPDNGLGIFGIRVVVTF